MAINSRVKGSRFERDIAKRWQAAGFAVRGLEGSGDHLIVGPDGGTLLHEETKRHERLRLPEWLEQVQRDCPAGVPWLLVFKQSLEPIYALQPLEQVIEREARMAGLLRERELGRGRWPCCGLPRRFGHHPACRNARRARG